MKHAVSNLRMAENGDALIEGWLVPFKSPFRGNKDVYGTFFDAETDYHLDWYNQRPLMYAHSLDDDIGMEAIGTIRSAAVRDEGVWAEAQISQKAKYFNTICEMARAGQLQFSSGSIDYMVRVDQRSGHVEEWPIAEGSLTPIPANPAATLELVDSYSFGDYRAACRSADLVLKDLETFMAEHVETAQVIRPDALADTRSVPAHPEAQEPGTPAARAALGSDPVDTEKSFEDIRDDIECLLNPYPDGPYEDAYGHWSYVMATFPTYVLVIRYCDMPGCCDDDPSYWRIAYSLDDQNEPVLGEQQQMEQVFVPVAARAGAGSLSLEASTLTRHAVALARRTKDLSERRAEENRPLSRTNRRAIERHADALRSTAGELTTLLARDETVADAAARAAYWSNPETQQRELELLDLEVFSIDLS